MNDFEKILHTLAQQPCCGLGCVIVPPDVDKQAYIDRCFSTETVSVMSQAGGMSFNNVPISVDALQQIEFPEKAGDFGSAVVFVFHPKTSKPIIVAVLSKKSELYGVAWKQFKRFKGYKGNFVSVLGDGRKGNLYVTVQGDENSKGGQIMINIGEPSNKGKLSVSVQGDIYFINQNFELNCLTTKIVSKDSFMIQTKDFQIENETTTVKSSDKISLGNDNYEKAVLGETLKDLLSDMLDKIMALTVSTAMGPSGPPINVTDFATIKAKVDQILSNKVELE